MLRSSSTTWSIQNLLSNIAEYAKVDTSSNWKEIIERSLYASNLNRETGYRNPDSKKAFT